MANNEMINVYSPTAAGMMLMNTDILNTQHHNQIIFHKLSNEAILCEIKPFVLNERVRQYVIKGASFKIIENIDATYFYFNSEYYGCIKQQCNSIKFEKVQNESQEYGVIDISGDKKYIVLFNSTKVLFCGQYIDSEIIKNNIKIYTHIPNIFNIGSLISYDFSTREMLTKSVSDRENERKQINGEFNVIYFLEAIKCGRFKYAYNKLSYELKTGIDIDTLSDYFKQFDTFIYLQEQDVYITLKNNKVVGVNHFVIRDNLIDNIY